MGVNRTVFILVYFTMCNNYYCEKYDAPELRCCTRTSHTAISDSRWRHFYLVNRSKLQRESPFNCTLQILLLIYLLTYLLKQRVNKPGLERRKQCPCRRRASSVCCTPPRRWGSRSYCWRITRLRPSRRGTWTFCRPSWSWTLDRTVKKIMK